MTATQRRVDAIDAAHPLHAAARDTCRSEPA